MNKFPPSLELFILQSVALVCVALDISDIFNIINVLPPSYIPMLTLLLVALLLSSQATLQKHVTSLKKDMRKYSRENETTYWSQAHTQVNEQLRELLGDDFFIELFSSLHSIFKETIVHFKESEQFFYYYQIMLKKYPSETFLCLTNTKTCSFWLNPHIITANERFTRNGGKIELIFVFEEEAELISTEIKDFLRRQEDIHVKVSILPAYLVLHSQVPEYARKNIIVGSKNIVKWEIFTDDKTNIVSSTLTMNSSKVNEDRRIIKSVQKYTSNTSSLSNTA